MRESMWGIFIIVIGAVGIIAINLFQRLTVTDANTYVLMKESTKAAMYDSIDIAYFRNTGNVKIIEEKFVENFTRRFAESAVINTNYKIVVHDIVEYPPKVSLSILTDLDDMKNNEYKVLQTIDSIFETVYSRADFFDRFGVHSEEWFPGSQIWDGTPIDPVEENFCKNAKTDIDECISGDLQFLRWEELERTVLQICDTELGKLGPKDRDAFYQECICGKWSEEKFETINSGRPRIKDNVATYTWNFKKDGPVNDIDETVTDKIIGAVCLRDLKILKKDDLPRTNLGGIECGPDGVVVMVGQSIKLYPRYIPNNAVNRNLNWQKVSGASHLNLIPLSQLYFPYPQKDIITVFGVSKGETVVSAIPVDNPSGIKAATCLVRVLDKPDFSCPPSKQILVGSTFWPRIIKGKDFPVDYTLTYDVFNRTLASYDSSTDLITGLNPGSTNYIATVTIDGKSYSELCPFEVTPIIPKVVPPISPTCLSNPVTILNSMPTAQAVIVNPGNKPVSNYALFNTAYLNINSSTGLMTVLKRAFNDRYLSFRVTFNDNTYLDCPITLLGIDPPPPPPDPAGLPAGLKGECNVGDIQPLWDQVDYFMPIISEGQVRDEYETAQYNASRASISIPIRECGRIGTIEDGCRGYWSTRTLTKKGIAELGTKSYKVRFDPYYEYLDWQKASVFCPNVFTKGDIRLYSEFPSGIKTQYSPESFYKTGSYLITDGNVAQGYFVDQWLYPSEMEKGLSGSDTITFSVQAPDGFKKPTPMCVIRDGGGKIKKLDIDTWQYTPPSPWPSDQVTVTIHCSILEDSTIERDGNILLLKDACGKYSLQVTPDEIWSKPAGHEKSATATMILTNGDEMSTPENDLISVDSDSGLVVVKTNNTTHQGTITASGAGSGVALIKGLRAQRGAVCSPYLTPPVPIYVCSTAEYYCDSVIYNLLDGNRCYSNNTKAVICDSKTGGTQILYNNNCYNKTSLPVATTSDPYCKVGTKVCFDGDCNEEICIYDGIARSTGKCDTYSESFSSGICTNSGSDGDNVYKVCKYAYKQKAISSSATYTSNYVYSSSKEAMDACKLNVKTGYACEDTPKRTYTYTCTSSTTSDCPATHPWVTSTTCYKTTGLTDGTYSCSSGTLVATNRCVTSSSPKADLVCPDPDNYVKINQTDEFCVNKSDYEPAELKCPSSIGR